MEYASYKEAGIAYTVSGKGPAVVLLHGFLCSGVIWKAFVKELSKRHKVIIPDLPGHGQSESFGYVHTMEEMAGAVLAVLKKLRIRKCTLVGHSMGGYAALAFADYYPDMVRGLCMFHSTARPDSEARKKDRDRAIEIIKRDRKGLICEQIPGLFTEENRIKLRTTVQQLKASAMKMEARAIMAALGGMRDRPGRELVIRFAPYPVLYIIGRHDPVFEKGEQEEQAEMPEQGEVLILDDVAHMGFYEDPETIKPVLADFVRRTARRKRLF